MLKADIGGLMQAGGEVTQVASEVRDIAIQETLLTAGQGVVGSEVAQACLWVGTRLDAAAKVWSERLAVVGSAARATAEDLDLTDAEVAASMGSQLPR